MRYLNFYLSHINSKHCFASYFEHWNVHSKRFRMFIISQITIPFDFYDIFCTHELFDSDGKLERMVQFKFLHYSWMHVLSRIFCSICFCILHTGLWAAGFHLLVICIHDINLCLYFFLYISTSVFLYYCIFKLLYFCT